VSDREKPASEGISRRQAIKRGAVVGSAAIWLPPLIQSIRVPANAQEAGSPLPCGFMTGGGFVRIGSVTVNYNVIGHCANPTIPPDKVDVSWSTGSGNSKISYDFNLTSIATSSCEDTPNVDPEPPDANFDTYKGTGSGTLKVKTTNGTTTENATITFSFTDAGEGPLSSDMVNQITIVDSSNTTVLNVLSKKADGGNLQAHTAFGNKCT
jgi:hypothetical protein